MFYGQSYIFHNGGNLSYCHSKRRPILNTVFDSLVDIVPTLIRKNLMGENAVILKLTHPDLVEGCTCFCLE